jgi:RHS repeat-associated protein
MTYPNGTVLAYNYGTANSLNDVLSRLASLSTGTVTLESYKYLGLATVVERNHSQSGLTLTYISATAGDAGDLYAGLDRFGRVVRQTWTTSGGATVVDDYQYTYDRDSNVLTKENWAAWHTPLIHSAYYETYAYDGLNRLTGVSWGNENATSSHDYSLDAAGNITETTADGVTTTRTVNSLNQLTATGTDSQYMSELAYDAAGAMTTDSLGRTLVYDAWGRLVQVRSGQTVVQDLTYDGTGRLIIRSDGTTPTDIYFTATQDIEQRTGVTAQSNGTAGVLTFFSPVYVNAVLARDRDTDANGTLDQRAYFTSDANFNVTSVISAAGTALQHQVYDAYGNITFTGADADWTPLSPNADGYAQEHLYQGMLRNAAIGWYFAGQSNVGRWYGPAEMTWSRADSAGYIDGASLYAFVAANPINRVDPNGLDVIVKEFEDNQVGEDRNAIAGTGIISASIYVEVAKCPDSAKSGDLYQVKAVYDHLVLGTEYVTIPYMFNKATRGREEFSKAQPEDLAMLNSKRQEAIQYERTFWQTQYRDTWTHQNGDFSRKVSELDPAPYDALGKQIQEIYDGLCIRLEFDWQLIELADSLNRGYYRRDVGRRLVERIDANVGVTTKAPDWVKLMKSTSTQPSTTQSATTQLQPATQP